MGESVKGEFGATKAKLLAVIQHPSFPLHANQQVAALAFLSRHRGELPLPDSRELTLAVARALGVPPSRVEQWLTLPIRDLRRALRRPTPTPERLPEELPYPTRGWLGFYVDLHLASKVPIGFTFWAGCAVLGTVARRQLYFDRGKDLFLNNYYFFVGPSGLGKSDAIGKARGFVTALNQLVVEAGGPTYFVSSQKETPEHLIDELAAANLGRPDTTGLVVADEAITLIGAQTHGGQRMVNLLTAVYSGEEESFSTGTRGRGKVTLPYVTLNQMFGSTVDWVQQMAVDTVTGGYLARNVVVRRQRNVRMYPDPPTRDPNRIRDLVDRLLPWVDLKSPAGDPAPIELARTLEANEWFYDWFMVKHRESMDLAPSLLRPFLNRKEEHLHRTAGLLALSDALMDEGQPAQALAMGQLDVTLAHFTMALALLEIEELGLPALYEELSSTPAAKTYTWVLERLTQLQAKLGGPVPKRELQRACSHRLAGVASVEQVMRYWEVQGEVRVGVTPKGGAVYSRG